MVAIHPIENSSVTHPSRVDVVNLTLDCPPDVESWIPFYTFLFPVFLTGLAGNGLVIFIFARHKDMRSAPNTLLVSLALADFSTLVFCATAPAYDFISETVPAICPVIRLAMETAMHGTGFSLVSLSIERYFAIARPFRTKSASKTFIRGALTFTWLGGLTFTVVKQMFQIPAKCEKCVRMIDPSNLTATFALLSFLISYVIPLTVIMVFYVLMAHKLYFSGRSIQPENETVTRQLEVRKRIAFRVLLLVIIYAVSFFPYSFFSLKIYLLEDLSIAQDIGALITILYCIGCTHIALNPFILYILSKTFRAHFNNYLFCCFIKHTVPPDESNSNKQKRNSDKQNILPSPVQT